MDKAKKELNKFLNTTILDLVMNEKQDNYTTLDLNRALIERCLPKMLKSFRYGPDMTEYVPIRGDEAPIDTEEPKDVSIAKFNKSTYRYLITL